MARKSRKNKVQPPMPVLVQVPAIEEGSRQPAGRIPTAAYVRLSSENGSRGDEGSIQTQIALVHDYINDNPELTLFDTYTDNGYTGTNFNRPEFERMMEDVRRGRVQCIVVKDLSRFGRNYLEAGQYIESIFPRLGVRLIAVTDDFDSTRKSDVEGLELPIKNLVNSMYAKDISRKLSSYYEERNKAGLWNGCKAPYGYLLEDGRLVPDPATAKYVRVIFYWFLSGVNVNDIAKRLNLAGAVTPTGRLKKDSASGERGSSWSGSGVGRILDNQTYAGDTINGKTKSEKYRGIDWHLTDRDEWSIFPDTHVPLVKREDFEKAQMIRGRSREEKQRALVCGEADRNRLPAVFKGKVYCASCGRMLSTDYRKRRSDGSRYNVYRCIDAKNGGSCAGGSINEDLLKILVMDQIRMLCAVACDKRKLVIELIRENPWQGKLGKLQRQMEACKAQSLQAEKRETQAYADFKDGILEKEDYMSLKESLRRERMLLEGQTADLRKEEESLRKAAEEFLSATDGFEDYMQLDIYRPEIGEELIDRIELYPDGSVNLSLKCKDVFEAVERILGE